MSTSPGNPTPPTPVPTHFKFEQETHDHDEGAVSFTPTIVPTAMPSQMVAVKAPSAAPVASPAPRPAAPPAAGMYTGPSPASPGANSSVQMPAAAAMFPGAQPAGEFELVPRPIWPTLLFTRKYRDHAKDAPSIIEHLYELKAKEKENIASGVAVGMKSQNGLFESKMDLFETTQHEPLKRLAAFIESSTRRSVWLANGQGVDPKRIRIEWKDSWFHITNGGGFHDAHYHGGCSWCGIYYLQISDVPTSQPKWAPNGVNRFYSPFGSGGKYDDYGNSYLSRGVQDIPPVPGMLMIFPSYLLHSGLAYSGEKDRVILSFNTASWLNPE